MISRASAAAPLPDAPAHLGFVLGSRNRWPGDVLDDAEPMEEQVLYTPATDRPCAADFKNTQLWANFF